MSSTIITERRSVIWLQVVVSKSGGEPHMVRCFEGGLCTCDCDGFMWRGKCSHIAQGKLQEAREALAAAAVTAPTSDQAARKAEIARKAAAAYADLFGAEKAVA